MNWSKDVAAIRRLHLLVFGEPTLSHRACRAVLRTPGRRQEGRRLARTGMSNARLAILPGLTHYNIFSSPALASTVTPFLDVPMRGAK